MHVMRNQGEVVRIDAPEWFAMGAFREAIERRTAPSARNRLATFHQHGEAVGEYSDVFVLFAAREELDQDGTMQWIVESSDLLDEPGLESVYEAVVRTTRELRVQRGIMWLTNLGLKGDR
jgi:hypothetical protein